MNEPVRDLFIGDAAHELRRLPPASADMVLTSPPYANGLRDYGVAGQLGMESSVEQWVANLANVIEPLEKVLAPHGTLWLNVGDGYSRTPGDGAPRKSMLLAPERIALALIDRGWILRNKIIWVKPNGMPTAVADRLRHQWEAVYVFARSPRYYFDLDVLRVPHVSRPPKRRDTSRPRQRRPDAWQGPNGDRGDGLARNRALGRLGHDLGKNPGDVWTIPVSAWRGDHHATFPEALAERCIRAGCPEVVCEGCGTPWRQKMVKRLGAAATRSASQQMCDCPQAPGRVGIVLDPFMGSGTTAVAAEAQGRDWRGVELNPEFARMASQRIAEARRVRSAREKDGGST